MSLLLSILVLITLRIEAVEIEPETKINGKIDASVANYDSNSFTVCVDLLFDRNTFLYKMLD